MRFRKAAVIILSILSAGCAFKEAPPVVINEVLPANSNAGIDPYFSNYSEWIEIYNPGDKPVDLSGYYLSSSLKNPFQWKIPPDTIIQPKGFLIFWADKNDVYNHTNFKLKPSDQICLVDPYGRTIDRLIYGIKQPDISVGRKPDGAQDWFYFETPTPGASNTTTAYRTQENAGEVKFSLPGGFYQGKQVLTLSTNSSSAEIHYTEDGSIPTMSSSIYTSPITISSTKVIRARAFANGLLPGPTTTHTYFIDEHFTLPVVSITTDPVNLWDNKTGVYVKGEHAEPRYPYWEANFLQKWERPGTVEFYQSDGKLGFQLDAGIGIAGTTSSANPVKSFYVRGRPEYGKEWINYRIFPDMPLERFKSFILRASGDDWASTVFRDAMIQGIIKGQMDIDMQNYRPVIVFLNGEYWGILYLEEKIDKFFLAAHHSGVDPKQIDLLVYLPDPEKRRPPYRAIDGDEKDYLEFLEFIKTHNLALPENYKYVRTKIDVDEYINYQIAELYIANADWPGGNVKLWKPKSKDGKWRWILYDTDLGFGLYFDYTSDMISFATATNSVEWANPPDATLLFRKLLENPDFRNDFIQRFASYLNTSFHPDRVIKIINQKQAEIEPEMPRYIEKWKNQPSEFQNLRFPSTIQEWKANVEKLRIFARERPAYIRQHIIEKFKLSGTAKLTIKILNPEMGKVFVNGVFVPEENFTGIYFKDVPIVLKAVPNPGYRFLSWQGAQQAKTNTIQIVLKEDATIQAKFDD